MTTEMPTAAVQIMLRDGHLWIRDKKRQWIHQDGKGQVTAWTDEAVWSQWGPTKSETILFHVQFEGEKYSRLYTADEVFNSVLKGPKEN